MTNSLTSRVLLIATAGAMVWGGHIVDARADRTDIVVAKAEPGVRQLAKLLVQFETAVKWNKTSSRWPRMRVKWMGQVRTAKSVPQLARAVAQLEGHLGWAVNGRRWGGVRQKWVRALERATTVREVADRLRDLEYVVERTALSRSWAKTKRSWAKRLRSL